MEQNIKAPELKKPTPAVPVKQSGSPLQLFFVEALKDIYWAEKELTNALPKMIMAATTTELMAAIEEHLAETENHVLRLEEIFGILGKPAETKICFAMQGLLKEAESIVAETNDGSVTRDAALIMAAQKVEHYEIATYGSLVEYAKTLGYNDIHGILQTTFEEERMADQGLTLIAQNKINWEAEITDGLARRKIK
jgi:ferritin-like metal-binding protein YciE